MRAIVDVDGVLGWREVGDPRPGDDEALLEVRAAGLNRADLSQRAGHYPPPPGASEILGLEAAGVVVSGGKDSFPPGSRAMALLSGGGYAERVAVPRKMLMAVPESWSWEQAAAFPETFFTAYLNLFIEAGLQPGERVLIHAGASGVGTSAIQLAVHSDCFVIATAGSDEKVETCRKLGAHLAINYKASDFAKVVREQLGAVGGAEGVDVILDVAGASYLERNVQLLATGGRLVVIATLGGSRGELDLRDLMRKRASVRGSTLRARPLEHKLRIKEGLLGKFGGALQSGLIAPIIDSVFDAEEAQAAHERMAGNRNAGKIVLALGSR